DWMQPLQQFYNVAGIAAQLGSGTSAQPFATVTDYDNWLARASQVPVLLDTMQANMREGMAKGVVRPRPLIEKVLPQLDALIHDDPEQTLFWGPIANMPESFGDEDRARLTSAYRELIAERLMPAYRQLRDFVANEYLPACRDTVAQSELPDGEAWYAFLVREYTSTGLSPEQIHQIGLDEVARIQAEMDAVMREVGFEGSRQEFFEFMRSDKQFEFASEDAMLAAYRALE